MGYWFVMCDTIVPRIRFACGSIFALLPLLTLVSTILHVNGWIQFQICYVLFRLLLPLLAMVLRLMVQGLMYYFWFWIWNGLVVSESEVAMPKHSASPDIQGQSIFNWCFIFLTQELINNGTSRGLYSLISCQLPLNCYLFIFLCFNSWFTWSYLLVWFHH
jgi:hypothetical protein